MWPFQGSTIDFIGQLIGNDPILQARFVDQFFFGPAVRSNEYYHIDIPANLVQRSSTPIQSPHNYNDASADRLLNYNVRVDNRLPPKKWTPESHHRNYCRFCKNNGEKERVYSSHIFKDANGRVRCPRLRKYVCDICGASGDFAHTKRYCPKRELLS